MWFRKATRSAAVTFFDTVLYFSLMACTAGAWYSIQAGTVYEIDLCILVALLTSNASIVMSFVCSGAEKTRETFTRKVIQFAGLLAGIGTICSCLWRISYDGSLEDFHCYGRNNLPHRFFLVSVQLQLILWGVFLAGYVVSILLMIFMPSRSSSIRPSGRKLTKACVTSGKRCLNCLPAQKLS